MGVISHKVKGKAWQMRQASIQRYETLIPELEAISQRHIPFNRQGILMLSFAEEDLANWEKLLAIRQSQGWQLEIWDADQVKFNCPQLDCQRIKAAVYSPQDRQVDPVSLTLALIDAAKSNGVTFHFGVTVEGYYLSNTSDNQHQCQQIKTKSLGEVDESPLIQNVDWLVVSAGLGSLQSLEGIEGWVTPSTGTGEAGGEGKENSIQNPKSKIQNPYCPSSTVGSLQKATEDELGQLIDIRPVLGQAIHLQLSHCLGNPDFQPVITGNDVHIVPRSEGLSSTEYWVGATVEFPIDSKDVVPNSLQLDAVMQQAIAFCPALAAATVVRTWSGLRPRPEGRPAPVIGHLPGFSNVLLATGHYRNGVLLAPATAQVIRQMILDFRF
jgi:glycine/D-amino acid oxidase-like deaminating enzyme